MRRAPTLPALSTAAPSSPNISLSFMFVVDKRGHETATTPEGSVMRMRLPRAVVGPGAMRASGSINAFASFPELIASRNSRQIAVE